MTNGKVDCEEFTSECAVPGFCGLEAFRKETKWLPNVVDVLLEDCTNGYIGGIGHEAQFSIGLGVRQHGGVSEGSLDLLKGGCCRF